MVTFTSLINETISNQIVSVVADDGSDFRHGLTAMFGDENAHIAFVQDMKGRFRIQSMESSPTYRGRDMLVWFNSQYGRPFVDEVARGVEGFWERMKQERLIQGWSSARPNINTQEITKGPHLTETIFPINEMPLPADWDQTRFNVPGEFTSKTFHNALTYARKKSSYIARGGSRAVFKLEYDGRPTVLKIAMNAAGLAQNEYETSIVFDPVMGKSSIIIPGIDYDERHKPPLWIHMEFAHPVSLSEFELEVGGKMNDFIEDLYHRRPRDPQLPVSTYNHDPIPSKFSTNPIANELYKFWANSNFDIVLGEFARVSNWGKYQHRLVLVDLGMGRDTFDKHNLGNRAAWRKPRGFGPAVDSTP